MTGDSKSPLLAIQEKEFELADRLAAAKAEALNEVLAAQKWAANLREQAQRGGQADAATEYRAALDQADADAQRILDEGERAAAQIAQAGRNALPEAIARILEIVLPQAKDL
jgi:vacuolar-type H+-ATPase subunit H